MQQRTLGPRTVSAIGLGGMPMSIEGRPDEARSIATIHAALDEGVTLIDTADAYHLHAGEVGHNEELIAKALRKEPQDLAQLKRFYTDGTIADVCNGEACSFPCPAPSDSGLCRAQ